MNQQQVRAVAWTVSASALLSVVLVVTALRAPLWFFSPRVHLALVMEVQATSTRDVSSMESVSIGQLLDQVRPMGLRYTVEPPSIVKVTDTDGSLRYVQGDQTVILYATNGGILADKTRAICSRPFSRQRSLFCRGPDVSLSPGDISLICLVLFTVFCTSALEWRSGGTMEYARGLHPAIVAAETLCIGLLFVSAVGYRFAASSANHTLPTYVAILYMTIACEAWWLLRSVRTWEGVLRSYWWGLVASVIFVTIIVTICGISSACVRICGSV